MVYATHADLGGQTGHGRVVPEPEGELFHEPWEPRVLALTLAMGATGLWNIDMSRAARETLEDYEKLSYYQIWIGGLCKLMQQRGLVSAEELEQGRAILPTLPVPRVLRAAHVLEALAKGSPTARHAAAPALYRVGQRVRMRSPRPPHHTRLPGYVSGKVGIVERVLGAHVFADSNAQGLGEQARCVYTVAFEGTELWARASAHGGDPGDVRGLVVSVDAWEPYLEEHVS